MEDNPNGSSEVSETQDPIEYLLNKTEYHEWQIVVKDASGAQEVFGVQASHLSAHSLVFRTMLTDPKWITSKTLEIDNITPEVFKIIFRFVNGGGLPEMSRAEAVELALAAEMYMIPRLMWKACKRLLPYKTEDIFLALDVVAYISAPDLEPSVIKMLQKKTEEVLNSATFLKLTKQQLEFIFKQDTLSVTEVEIWKALVKWGRQRVADEDAEETLRSVIQDLLKYVRLHTLSQEEIVEEVKPTEVLTDGELASLLCAVIRKQPWKQTGFCDIQAVRKLTQVTERKVRIFTSLGHFYKEGLVKTDMSRNSSFTINTKKNTVELKSFMIWPCSEDGGKKFYNITGNICVRVYKQGHYQDCGSISIQEQLVFGGDDFLEFPAKVSSGNFLKLEANSKFVFTVTLSPAHLAIVEISSRDIGNTINKEIFVDGVMTVKFNDYIHIKTIRYRVLP